ncbi:MAG: restriction endonuclease subunit S [Muribaculaceae bacterium]|nr:restriction endonuclease subunit S [Muribaculaceae bacterium]
MDKNNWTYKKLGEVCYIGLGFTHTPTYVDDGIPFLSVKDISGGKIDFSDTKFVSEKEYINAPKGAKPQKGDILFCRVGTMGKPVIIDTDIRFCTFVSLGYLSILSKELINVFVKYWMLSDSFNDQIKASVRGLAIKNLNTGWLRLFTIPIPPLAEQERIVTELDLLSSIIEKKKAQLKEYDKLAQSIFYDMFGDPITNEKGWEVKTMGEVGELQRGSGLSKKDLIESGFPCILYGQIHTRFGAYTKTHIACIPQELVRTAKIAHFGDVVMAITSEDVEGSCKSVAWMGDYDIAVGSDAAIYRHTLNGIYVSYYTQTKAFYFEKAKYAKGFKVTHISTKEIAKIPIPLPPLFLQQEFAEKIESIEQQKLLIQQSIIEVQTMLDYTMDKYFG